MKTMYINNGSNIIVDTENNTADHLNASREAISRIFAIKEPMHIVYGCGETHCEIDAEAGDIVVVFYDNSFKNPLVVIKSKEWTENLVEYEKREQEERERWAKANKASECDKCCDECPSGER